MFAMGKRRNENWIKKQLIYGGRMCDERWKTSREIRTESRVTLINITFEFVI